MAGEDDARTQDYRARVGSAGLAGCHDLIRCRRGDGGEDGRRSGGDLRRPHSTGRQCRPDRIRHHGWADTARHRRKRADAGGARHAGQSGILQGARPDRAVRSQGAADQVPGQPADRLERPLAAIWRRRLQRRADHGTRRCRRLFRSARLRRWRGASSPMARIRATRPSRANRRSCLRSTTKPSRISRIDPTSGCATPPSP